MRAKILPIRRQKNLPLMVTENAALAEIMAVTSQLLQRIGNTVAADAIDTHDPAILDAVPSVPRGHRK